MIFFDLDPQKVLLVLKKIISAFTVSCLDSPNPVTIFSILSNNRLNSGGRLTNKDSLEISVQV